MNAMLLDEVVQSSVQKKLIIAVVIPCYRVRQQIKTVLEHIGPEVSRIFCIDDACPEGSCEIINQRAAYDFRIELIRHETNQGVGQATVTGYRRALSEGADIIVKLDGDGQMDPQQIPHLINPILHGDADYVKGNRLLPNVRCF